MAAIPGWKQALLERKKQQEVQETIKATEDTQKLSHLPAWKRDLILKRKQSSVPNHNGGAVINDNMSFGGGGVTVVKTTTSYANKPAVRQVSSSEIQSAPKQVNGPRTSYIENKAAPDNSYIQNGVEDVSCRDAVNANTIPNGYNNHTNDGKEINGVANHESELKYQPGFVNKLRDKFKPQQHVEESIVQIRRRSVTIDHSQAQPLPRPASVVHTEIVEKPVASVNIRTVEQKSTAKVVPTKIAPTTEVVSTTKVVPPTKDQKTSKNEITKFHDNNNLSNGSKDSIDGHSSFSLQQNESQDEEVSVKNKVSSILSRFETGKPKQQNNFIERRRTPPSVQSTNVDELSKSKPEPTKVDVTLGQVTVKPTKTGDIPQKSVRNEIPVNKPIEITPAPHYVEIKSADVKPQRPASQPSASASAEVNLVKKTPQTKTVRPSSQIVNKTSDEVPAESIKKIRQAGQSWLFGQGPEEQKAEEEIVLTNDTLDVVFNAPKEAIEIPEALPFVTAEVFPEQKPASASNLTLDLKPAHEESRKTQLKKSSSPLSPSKKGFKSKKETPSPEKKSPERKVTSPEKKKGFFGAFKKDKTKVKIVEVKEKSKKSENPNFSVHGGDSPLAVIKRNAVSAPPSKKSVAPPPPRPSSKSSAPRPPPPPAPLPEKVPQSTKSKTAFREENDKIIISDLDSGELSPLPDIGDLEPVPFTNIDDIILDDRSDKKSDRSDKYDLSLDLTPENLNLNEKKTSDNWDYQFLDEELNIKPRPMKTSGIEFAGANVILDKSSLQKKGEKSEKKNARKIQFEEKTPEMFEYPSEQSLMDSPGQSGSVVHKDYGVESNTDSETDTDVDVDNTKSLSSTPAIGATVLGGYRGKFVDDYTLGSKPSTQVEDHYIRPRTSSISDRESDSGDEVTIAPALEDEEIFNWSEAASADILF